MTKINRSALVAYTPRQMFELVNNIEEYPRFLQWCHESVILHRDEKEVVATLDIVWSGFHKSFTTRNVLHPFNRMEIALVKGPFKNLVGDWGFTPVGEGCKVSLDMEFELAGHMFDVFFQPIFNHIANSLVEAFCKRAVEVYGG